MSPNQKRVSVWPVMKPIRVGHYIYEVMRRARMAEMYMYNSHNGIQATV